MVTLLIRRSPNLYQESKAGYITLGILFLSVLIFCPPNFVWGLTALGILSLPFLRKRNAILYYMLLLVPIDRFYFPTLYHLKPYQIILGIGVVTASLSYFLKKRLTMLFNWNLLDWSIILMFSAQVLSYVFTVDPASYLKSILLHGIFFSLYFYLRCHCRTEDPYRILHYMVSVGAIYMVYGFSEFLLAKLDYLSLNISNEIYVYGGRPLSVFKEPDWFGGYLAFIISLTLPFANNPGARDTYKVGRWILYLALFMSLILVVRSLWLGLLIGIFCTFIFLKDARKIVFYSTMRIGVITVFFLVVFSQIMNIHFISIQDRFSSMFSFLSKYKYDPAVQTRINSYDVILAYIEKKPLQGYGVGAWEHLSSGHQYINSSLSTNNIILTPIFEMGLVGCLVYILFFLALLKMINSGMISTLNENDTRYIIGIALAVISSFVVCIFNDIMLTGFYWAFIAAFNNFVDSLNLKYVNSTAGSQSYA